jgi:hypothetical protein
MPAALATLGLSAAGSDQESRILLTRFAPQLDFMSIGERFIHRHFVYVFQIAADGHAHRNASNEQPQWLE